jgi:hypothetical protein
VNPSPLQRWFLGLGGAVINTSIQTVYLSLAVAAADKSGMLAMFSPMWTQVVLTVAFFGAFTGLAKYIAQFPLLKVIDGASDGRHILVLDSDALKREQAKANKQE